MRGQQRVVADAAAKGCVVVSPEEGYADVQRLLHTG
jgi:hypothetical protein